MVTGIDLVRCQILVAQGQKLHDGPIGLPQQKDIPLYGYALQCRVTTEDPTINFTPEYGRRLTYRSPAGFGVRLDGGSAYSGATITPYYDSLLVKISSWAREFDHACNRADRALREFRVRGVKTNIPFLENVVNHPDFRAGNVTTSFIDQTPALINFSPRKRGADMLSIANFVSHRLPNLFSLEMWGGASFDVSMRFLLEDPWSRLRKLRAAIPNICFQMLFRASNAVGYTAYPANVVREFVLVAVCLG